MDKQKKRNVKEIRFMISKKRYNELKKEADNLSVPLASLIKIKISVDENGTR